MEEGGGEKTEEWDALAEGEQMKSGGWLEVFGCEQALELGCDGDGEEGADAMSYEEGFVGGVGLM